LILIRSAPVRTGVLACCTVAVARLVVVGLLVYSDYLTALVSGNLVRRRKAGSLRY